MVVSELNATIDYVLYCMSMEQFEKAIDFILFYKHGQKRKPEGRQIGDKGRMDYVWDDDNKNWIDYMESEKHRYFWNETKTRYELIKAGTNVN